MIQVEEPQNLCEKVQERSYSCEESNNIYKSGKMWLGLFREKLLQVLRTGKDHAVSITF